MSVIFKLLLSFFFGPKTRVWVWGSIGALVIAGLIFVQHNKIESQKKQIAEIPLQIQHKQDQATLKAVQDENAQFVAKATAIVAQVKAVQGSYTVHIDTRTKDETKLTPPPPPPGESTQTTEDAVNSGWQSFITDLTTLSKQSN